MKITYNSTRMKQQNVYYCHLHFSASLRWYRLGDVVSSGKSFRHATRRVQI